MLASAYRIHVVMLIRVLFQPFTGNKKTRIVDGCRLCSLENPSLPEK